jgi:pyroglutamyl-peptidase
MRAACNAKEIILATECNDRPMLRVLVTGFEPFGGASANPSAEALPLLAAGTIGGIALRTLLLPTSFGEAAGRVIGALRDDPADIVLSLGLAGGRTGLTVERVAINLADARIADNDGARPIDRPVVADGPAAYFATLPVKAVAASIRDAGIAASVSHSAGTFVCNHLLYSLLHWAATHRPGLRCGFVHLPWLPGQHATEPTMDAVTVARGVAAILGCLRDDVPEPQVAEGALS